MDVIYLSQDYQKLLDYMKVHGYGKTQTNWIKKCIRVVVNWL